jgi:hypothetical protein
VLQSFKGKRVAVRMSRGRTDDHVIWGGSNSSGGFPSVGIQRLVRLTAGRIEFLTGTAPVVIEGE